MAGVSNSVDRVISMEIFEKKKNPGRRSTSTHRFNNFPPPPPIFLFHSFFFFSPSPLESPTYVFAVRRDAWTRTFRTRGVDTPRHFYVTPSLLAVSECQSPPRLMATRTRPESFSILGPLDCAPISTVPFTHYRPFTDRFTLCLRQRGGEGRGEGGRR